MLNRNRKIVPLEEGFAELGLDPVKTIHAMTRNSQLVEERSSGTPGSAGPPRPAYGEPAHIADQDLLGGGDTDHLDEVRRVKTKKGSEAKRASRKAKLARRGKKAKLAKASKRYRKSSAGRQALKKHKAKTKGIKRKPGVRIFTADVDDVGGLSGLREDLNNLTTETSETVGQETPFQEAAENAALLCAMLADVFGVMGEDASAEVMLNVSNSGVSLAEDMAGVMSEDDLDEDHGQAFNELIGASIKGLRFWEGLGAPGLDEAVEMRIAMDALQE